MILKILVVIVDPVGARSGGQNSQHARRGIDAVFPLLPQPARRKQRRSGPSRIQQAGDRPAVPGGLGGTNGGGGILVPLGPMNRIAQRLDPHGDHGGVMVLNGQAVLGPASHRKTVQICGPTPLAGLPDFGEGSGTGVIDAAGRSKGNVEPVRRSRRGCQPRILLRPVQQSDCCANLVRRLEQANPCAGEFMRVWRHRRGRRVGRLKLRRCLRRGRCWRLRRHSRHCQRSWSNNTRNRSRNRPAHQRKRHRSHPTRRRQNRHHGRVGRNQPRLRSRGVLQQRMHALGQMPPPQEQGRRRQVEPRPSARDGQQRVDIRFPRRRQPHHFRIHQLLTSQPGLG